MVDRDNIKRMEELSGGVSKVTINGQIVKKTYTFEEDSMYEDTTFGYITAELFILNLLNGIEGFPKIIDIELDKPHYSIIMPYLGQPVTKRLYPLKIFIQIMKRVLVLHEHNIVHCDLKPENILIDNDNNISIIDFSHSYIMDNFGPYIEKYGTHYINRDHPKTLWNNSTIGTYVYTAPETYDKTIVKTTAQDVWSLGCILYELITGKCLFSDSVWPKIPCNKCKGYLESVKELHLQLSTVIQKIDEIDDHFPEKKLLKMIFQKDPMKRPTIRQMLNELDIDYSVPILYQFVIPEYKSLYSPSSSRLRCFDFPYSLCQYIDKLMTYIVKHPSGHDKYEMCHLLHIMLACVFLDKGLYEPYDVLCNGLEYMKLLSWVIKNIRLSMIYGEC